VAGCPRGGGLWWLACRARLSLPGSALHTGAGGRSCLGARPELPRDTSQAVLFDFQLPAHTPTPSPRAQHPPSHTHTHVLSAQDDLRAGEEIARCPSCSLFITVIYDPVRGREGGPDAALGPESLAFGAVATKLVCWPPREALPIADACSSCNTWELAALAAACVRGRTYQGGPCPEAARVEGSCLTHHPNPQPSLPCARRRKTSRRARSPHCPQSLQQPPCRSGDARRGSGFAAGGARAAVCPPHSSPCPLHVRRPPPSSVPRVYTCAALCLALLWWFYTQPLFLIQTSRYDTVRL